MKRTVRFRSKAQSDLFEIAEYGRKEWGAPRSRAYLTEISLRITALVAYPEIGAEAGVDPACLRKIGSGKHVIFYLTSEHEIEVVRVLHSSMDFDRWLN